MKFTFTGRKIDLGEDVKAYAEKKIAKLDRYFRNDAEANIICHLERGRFTSEVTVRSDNMFFRAQSVKTDLYATFDEIVDTIDRQIRKNKTKLEKRLRSQGASIAAGITDMADELSEATDFVVRRKEFTLKPMSVEEAILQMNLLGHEFFVFRDDITSDTCVVYARRDGDYGLIVPEHKE